MGDQIVCSECNRTASDAVHDERNPCGHFFNVGPSMIAGRVDESPRIPIRTKSPGKNDYKWWARSYVKQQLIRDMARERIEAYFAGRIEIAQEHLSELESMMRELTKQLERRKRPPMERSEG